MDIRHNGAFMVKEARLHRVDLSDGLRIPRLENLIFSCRRNANTFIKECIFTIENTDALEIKQTTLSVLKALKKIILEDLP